MFSVRTVLEKRIVTIGTNSRLPSILGSSSLQTAFLLQIVLLTPLRNSVRQRRPQLPHLGNTHFYFSGKSS